jgi:hypothetical protein
MTLRPGEAPGHAIAVFPFLKTTEPIRLGNFTFRSSDDTTDLGAEDSAHLREIADMLFLQDNFRIRSASYALLPALDFSKSEPCLHELEYVQTIVAYCYSAPHPTFGDPFFHFEQTSLAIFSPEPVPIFLVRPEHHVEATAVNSLPTPDQWHRVPGYAGLYNFRYAFWVARGSRLYPPVPCIGLNISQDLAHDLDMFFRSPRHHLLPELLRQPETETAERFLRALKWHNRANTLANDNDSAIIDLAVAFETLLALPENAKTERFVDAVSLLLGRVPRLDLWAEQFYNARSDVAHEGRTERLRFVPAKRKDPADAPLYYSLLAYGREIFRLCIGTLLFGAQLGEQAGLRDKLVTNQERFEAISKTLDDSNLEVVARFAAIGETVALLSKFRFVGETGLRIETLIGAVQRAAKNLLQCTDSLEPAFKERLQNLIGAQRSPDCYEALAALEALNDLRIVEPTDPQSPQAVTRRLANLVWDYTGMEYYSLKKQRDKR